jgi:hypothetical protein
MADIKNDFATGLKAYWKMDEESGTRADSTANGHDLTDVNTVGYATGLINNGAVCEHDNQEGLTIADNNDFDIGNGDFAFSLWLKLDSNSYSGPLIRKGIYSANRSYMLYALNTSTCRWMVSTTGANDVIVLSGNMTSYITAGSWQHFVITRNSSVTKLYIDGTERMSATDNNTYYNSTELLALMSSSNYNSVQGGNYSLDGMIDEVGFWNGRGLSSSDVSTIYNSGSGIPYEAGLNITANSCDADPGFANVDTPADTSPFNSGDKVSYTVQDELEAGTYYWRVRAKDPTGTDTWSDWSATQTFEILGVESLAVSVFDQVTTDETISTSLTLGDISAFDQITIAEEISTSGTLGNIVVVDWVYLFDFYVTLKGLGPNTILDFSYQKWDAYCTLSQTFTKVGHSFKISPNSSYLLTKVTVKLAKEGSPTGNVYVRLYNNLSGTFGANSGGSIPAGDPIATSDPFDIAELGTALDLELSSVSFSFSGDQIVLLEPNTPYIISVEYNATTATDNLQVGIYYNPGDEIQGNLSDFFSGNWYSDSGALAYVLENEVLSDTSAPTSIKGTSVVGNGSILSEGEEEIVERGFVVVVPAFSSGFEDDSLAGFSTSGDVNWGVTTEDSYEGSYSAVSGTISDGQSSTLSLTASGDTVIFRYKVSSEEKADFLSFKEDSVNIFSKSGITKWERLQHLTTDSSHVFEWTYSKDSSAANGKDKAFLDKVIVYSSSSSLKFSETGSFSVGSFTLPITGLSEETSYIVQSYVVSSLGTFFGEPVYFTTILETVNIPLPIEEIGIVEDVQVNIALGDISVFDQITITEDTQALAILETLGAVIVFDQITTAETTSASLTLGDIVVFDQVTTAEAVSTSGTLGDISVFDQITTAETTSASLTLGDISAFDQITITEDIQAIAILETLGAVIVFDQVTITEAVSTSLTLGDVSVFDQFALVETLSAEIPIEVEDLFIIVVEEISLIEFTSFGKITLIGVATRNSSSLFSLPTHEAGDLIIITVSNASSVLPSVPDGWTVIQSGSTTTGSQSLITAFRVASDSSTVSGTWTGAVRIIGLVFRARVEDGATGAYLGIGASASSDADNASYIRYPALSLSNNLGTSAVIYSRARKTSEYLYDVPPDYQLIAFTGLNHAVNGRFNVLENPVEYDIVDTDVSTFRTHGVEIIYVDDATPKQINVVDSVGVTGVIQNTAIDLLFIEKVDSLFIQEDYSLSLESELFSHESLSIEEAVLIDSSLDVSTVDTFTVEETILTGSLYEVLLYDEVGVESSVALIVPVNVEVFTEILILETSVAYTAFPVSVSSILVLQESTLTESIRFSPEVKKYRPIGDVLRKDWRGGPFLDAKRMQQGGVARGGMRYGGSSSSV